MTLRIARWNVFPRKKDLFSIPRGLLLRRLRGIFCVHKCLLDNEFLGKKVTSATMENGFFLLL